MKNFVINVMEKVNLFEGSMRFKATKIIVFIQLIIFMIVFIPDNCFSQNVVINEMMSSNVSTISDEDGDYPDWIELYNSDLNPVNIKGFYLSDDITDIFKWRIPNVTIEPQSFLLVYASDKNRKIWANHWETIIDWGDVWKYRLGTSEPPSNWNQVSFDDSQWSSGPSGFGHGDHDDSTAVAPIISLYIRKLFSISDISNIELAQLHIDYDDGFVAYLNGIEFCRRNLGQPGIPPAYNLHAGVSHEAEMYQGGLPEAINIEHIQSLLQVGTNVMAIQVHNYEIDVSDMTLIPFFSLGMENRPANPNGVPALLRFSLPRLHTNYKIKSEGETIIFSDSLGQIWDQVNTGYIPPDISRGRQPDGGTSWHYFDEATPDSSNTTGSYAGTVPEPQFSLPGGIYSGSVVVSLSNSLPGSEIRYTLDGSEPTDSSPLFSTDLTIFQTTVVRARVFLTAMIPSKIITHTYFVDEPFHLPLISLSTTPANFWDDEIGIYAMGNDAEDEMPYYGANFWQDWERPVHIEFYEPNGSLGFSIDAGVKIHGNYTRGFAQKSLAIFARGRYGYSEINYQIFPDKPIDSFQAIILRNSGSDWVETLFRDALMTRLVEDIDIDIQAYRPAIVFINGEFWGIHNVREKINEHYLASNHDVDPDNVDFLESNVIVNEGDANHYEMLMGFLSTQNISDPANYEYVQTQMDVDNFISYQVSEIYYDNRDWPGNNTKFWRPRTPDGRWRWILYDTDAGFGLYNPYRYTANSLANATEPIDVGNPGWPPFILNKLLENPAFENAFINRFADFINYYFEPSRVIQEVNNISAMIEPDIALHLTKWGRSYNDWVGLVDVLINFATNR